MRIGWTQGKGIWYRHMDNQSYTIRKVEDHLNHIAGVYRYVPYQNGIRCGEASFPCLVAAQVWVESL